MEKGAFSTIFHVVDTNATRDRYAFTNGPAFTTRKDAEDYIRTVRLGTLEAAEMREIHDQFGERAWEYRAQGYWGGTVRVEPITLFDVNKPVPKVKSEKVKPK